MISLLCLFGSRRSGKTRISCPSPSSLGTPGSGSHWHGPLLSRHPVYCSDFAACITTLLPSAKFFRLIYHGFRILSVQLLLRRLVKWQHGLLSSQHWHWGRQALASTHQCLYFLMPQRRTGPRGTSVKSSQQVSSLFSRSKPNFFPPSKLSDPFLNILPNSSSIGNQLTTCHRVQASRRHPSSTSGPTPSVLAGMLNRESPSLPSLVFSPLCFTPLKVLSHVFPHFQLVHISQTL